MRDLGWAAGFLEGEGSFNRRGCERVSAVQVNKEPVDRLLALFGGATVQYERKHPVWKPTWQWYISGSRARGVMMTLFPLLSHKRQDQIRHAIA